MKLGSVGSLIKVPPEADPIFGRINRCAELGINVISVGFRDRRDPAYLQDAAELAAKKGVEFREPIDNVVRMRDCRYTRLVTSGEEEGMARPEAIGVTTTDLTSHGYVFDQREGAFGELRDSNALLGDVAALQAQYQEDGYVLLRSYLDRDRVLATRRELVEKLDSVGLIDRRHPLMDAIHSGSNAQLAQTDRNAYAKDLRSGPALREVVRRGRIMEFYQEFLGGEVRTLDYIWVRNVRVGAATGCHFDWVYMGRGTRNLYTTWIPMGDVLLEEGPLAVLEGSHRLAELQESYGAIDVDRDKNHGYTGGWLTKDVTSVQARYGGRWLTSEFRAGDMLLFGMFTLHCSLDNKSPVNRIRLSTDTRYQLASEPADERWTGAEPFGHGMD